MFGAKQRRTSLRMLAGDTAQKKKIADVGGRHRPKKKAFFETKKRAFFLPVPGHTLPKWSLRRQPHCAGPAESSRRRRRPRRCLHIVGPSRRRPCKQGRGCAGVRVCGCSGVTNCFLRRPHGCSPAHELFFETETIMAVRCGGGRCGRRWGVWGLSGEGHFWRPQQGFWSPKGVSGQNPCTGTVTPPGLSRATSESLPGVGGAFGDVKVRDTFGAQNRDLGL